MYIKSGIPLIFPHEYVILSLCVEQFWDNTKHDSAVLVLSDSKGQMLTNQTAKVSFAHAYLNLHTNASQLKYYTPIVGVS